MKQKHAATCFNTRENVVTENNPSVTPGNLFNIDEIGIHIHNQSDCIIIEKNSKIFSV
jgi:hypothetical protein